MKRLLHLNGIPLRKYHRLSEDDAQTAAELYRAGWSLARLGPKFDVDSDTVRRRLVQLAVPLRGARTAASQQANENIHRRVQQETPGRATASATQSPRIRRIAP